MKNRLSELRFDQIVVAFLALLVTGISLAPFFKVGFTTADDLEYYLTFLKGGYFQDAQFYASYSGRFYFLITKPLYSLIYATGSFALLKVLQYGCLLLSYGVFTWLIQTLFHSKKLSAALFVLLVCCTPVTPNLHVPFIAYPCFFSFSFALFCLALVAFVKYTETNRYALVVCSALLCFVSALFYETFLIFIFLFGVAILVRNIYKSGLKCAFTTKPMYREALPVAAAALLYVALYFTYRHFAVCEYDGSSFAHPLNWKNFFLILKRCTFAVAPLHQFRHCFEVLSVNSQVPIGHFQTFRFALTHASLAAYVNGALVAFVLACLLAKSKAALTWKSIGVAFVAALTFAFSSHLLIAVSMKYNLDWGSWMSGYVTSFYAYFGVVLALLLVGYALYKLAYNIIYLRLAVGVLLTLALFGVVVIDTSTNEHLAHDWERSQQRFRIMDEMIDQKAFSQMQEKDILYCPSLYYSGFWGYELFGEERNRWSEYIYLKSGKRLAECSNVQNLKDVLMQDSARRVFFLDMKESKTHNDMLVTLAPIKGSSWNLVADNPVAEALCDSAALFFYSPAKQFVVMLNRNDGDTVAALLNANDTVMLSGHWNRIPVKYSYWKRKSPVSVVNIKCPDMHAADFYVTDLFERFPEKIELR